MYLVKEEIMSPSHIGTAEAQEQKDKNSGIK